MVSEAGCGILGIKLRGDREGRWGEGRGQKRKEAGVGREREFRMSCLNVKK